MTKSPPPFAADDLIVLAATLVHGGTGADDAIQAWLDEHVRTKGAAMFLIDCCAHTTAELLAKAYPEVAQARADTGVIFHPEVVDPTDRAAVVSAQILAAAMAKDGDMVIALSRAAIGDADKQHGDLVLGHGLLGLAGAIRNVAAQA